MKHGLYDTHTQIPYRSEKYYFFVILMSRNFIWSCSTWTILFRVLVYVYSAWKQSYSHVFLCNSNLSFISLCDWKNSAAYLQTQLCIRYSKGVSKRTCGFCRPHSTPLSRFTHLSRSQHSAFQKFLLAPSSTFLLWLWLLRKIHCERWTVCWMISDKKPG
jgi:hypothetical protein